VHLHLVPVRADQLLERGRVPGPGPVDQVGAHDPILTSSCRFISIDTARTGHRAVSVRVTAGAPPASQQKEQIDA